MYWRNLAKEIVQNYILRFVYREALWQTLIFTGGTCLRKLYGLDRLSEDLDFDHLGEFEIEAFASGVKDYFKSELECSEVETRISGNGQTVFIKLPLFKQLELITDRTPEDLFVRCDFSKELTKTYGLSKGMITAGRFRFLVKAYDLPTLFANKLAAFLTRSFYKGKFQKIPFKGRDVYDLFWFTQLSAKSGYTLKPNPDRLLALTGMSSLGEVEEELKRKLTQVEGEYVYEDLLPLVESEEYLNQFQLSFRTEITRQIEMVLG